MEPASGVPLERLLAHSAWGRRLARALVHDESRADDVEQDAWLAALRHPPRHDAGLKSWLRRLVRHRAANARRAATRRETHEGAARSRPEGDSPRSEEHTSELQSLRHLVCRLLLEKKKKQR